MLLAAGSKLGPYQILGVIGAGGMGKVYRAKDTRLDRTVAIKVLPEHLSSNQNLRERFEREARAVSALNQANICTLHDIGHQDGIDFLVMEYIEGETFANRLSKARYPLQCRAHTSDLAVFRQICFDREYSCPDNLSEQGLVIDCGAYVGYSSAYFLSRFPGCDLIAIEPDPNNFEMLTLNLSPYRNSVKVLQSAVWSHPTKLTLSEMKYRDGYEWTRQVRECRPDEDSNLLAVDIATLLRESGHKRISILKVDIEGAEAVVFSRNYESWIDKVDNIVIELHDDSSFGNCSSVFTKGIAGREFSVTRCGELTVCTKPNRPLDHHGFSDIPMQVQKANSYS